MHFKDRPRSVDLTKLSEDDLIELSDKLSDKCITLITAAKEQCNEMLAPFGMQLLIKMEFAAKDGVKSSSQSAQESL